MAEIVASAVKELREKTGAGMMLCKKALQESNGDIDMAIQYLRKQGEISAGKRSGKSAREGKVGALVRDNAAVILELNSETDFVAKNKDFVNLLNNLLEAALASKASDAEAFADMASPIFDNKPIREVITENAGIIGENIGVKRLQVVEGAADEAIYSYIHMGGKIGVLLKLKSSKEALANEKAEMLGKDLCMQVAASNPISIKREDVPQEKIDSESEIYREIAKKEGKPEKILDRIVQGKLQKYYKENCLLEQPFVKDTEKSVSQYISEVSKQIGAEITVDSFIRYQLGVE